jgi:beta-exotoxin I transport system ATP-binding protein
MTNGAPVALRCRGLTKQFGARTALSELHLDVAPGETVGYLGPNGAGKTTTLRLLTGALRPTTGTASVLGEDCWRRAAQAHRHLGVLASDPVFEPRLDPAAVLAQSARARHVAPDSARPGQHALAERLGLELDRPTGELSRGNRQKLAVALAFWHSPRVLLLDEPTTGLDPLAQDIFHELVREAVADGAAVLLSSHVLSEVEAVADRVVVLRTGRVEADRSITDLVAEAPHDLRVTLRDPADAGVLDAVPGLTPVRRAGAVLEYRVPRRRLNDVVRALATVSVTDLRIREADLDSWFRGLYSIPPAGPAGAGDRTEVRA